MHPTFVHLRNNYGHCKCQRFLFSMWGREKAVQVAASETRKRVVYRNWSNNWESLPERLTFHRLYEGWSPGQPVLGAGLKFSNGW